MSCVAEASCALLWTPLSVVGPVGRSGGLDVYSNAASCLVGEQLPGEASSSSRTKAKSGRGKRIFRGLFLSNVHRDRICFTSRRVVQQHRNMARLSSDSRPPVSLLQRNTQAQIGGPSGG